MPGIEPLAVQPIAAPAELLQGVLRKIKKKKLSTYPMF
jgi:hypothetical protein